LCGVCLVETVILRFKSGLEDEESLEASGEVLIIQSVDNFLAREVRRGEYRYSISLSKIHTTQKNKRSLFSITTATTSVSLSSLHFERCTSATLLPLEVFRCRHCREQWQK
jgi:hypothetical protein